MHKSRNIIIYQNDNTNLYKFINSMFNKLGRENIIVMHWYLLRNIPQTFIFRYDDSIFFFFFFRSLRARNFIWPIFRLNCTDIFKTIGRETEILMAYGGPPRRKVSRKGIFLLSSTLTSCRCSRPRPSRSHPRVALTRV